MREIEVLASLKIDINAAKQSLEHFDYKGAKKTIDIYYFDEKRSNLKINDKGKLMECCRLREKNGRFFVTYKIDNYNDDVWLYSDEYETEIHDINEMKNIFNCLGLKELVIIDNTKHTYITPKYEVVLEEVKNLGNFIEVEALHDDESIDAQIIKNNIYKFIKELGIDVGDELNSGKPELLLNKMA